MEPHTRRIAVSEFNTFGLERLSDVGKGARVGRSGAALEIGQGLFRDPRAFRELFLGATLGNGGNHCRENPLMPFSEAQVSLLSGKLNEKVVKTRQERRKTLSCVLVELAKRWSLVAALRATDPVIAVGLDHLPCGRPMAATASAGTSTMKVRARATSSSIRPVLPTYQHRMQFATKFRF
jgi:hypothetical protein